VKRIAAPILALAVLSASATGADAQSLFERLFGPSRQPLQQPAPQYLPPREYRRPAPRRAPPAAAPSRQAPRAAQPAEPPEPAPEPAAAPYEPELLRLSEIMGSLAFLRSLCAAAEATEWPQRMQALMEAEGTTPGRRERLAGAYNKGYRNYALTYNACTPSATEASNRFLKEGDQLARTISGRYGS
jgi:uncharacterized protein (TIGR02301 family)